MQIVLVVIVLAIVAFLVYVATRPDHFRLERSAVMAAPPERIYAEIEDFARWRAWSPWEGLDPAMTRTLEGPPRGLGARYGWVGNKKVGQGQMEIVQATAPTHLGIKLDFLKPFEAHNITEFTLAPEGAGTRVTWSMHGPQPFMSKLFDVLMNMDKMVGRDYEKGLASLKQVVEQPPATAPA